MGLLTVPENFDPGYGRKRKLKIVQQSVQFAARVEMALVNAPDHPYDKLQANWSMRYWDPWKAYLSQPVGRSAGATVR
jgi:hypothetical protein